MHKLQVGFPPVINFSGELHQLKREVFEIFYASVNSILADPNSCYLKFCNDCSPRTGKNHTIHRSGLLVIFAPGQTGVAVGRAVCKKAWDMETSMMKHPDSVYNFYKKPFQAWKGDMSCSNKLMIGGIQNLPSESYSDIQRSLMESDSDSKVTAEELPRSPCNFDTNKFIELNKSTEFVALMDQDYLVQNSSNVI